MDSVFLSILLVGLCFFNWVVEKNWHWEILITNDYWVATYLWLWAQVWPLVQQATSAWVCLFFWFAWPETFLQTVMACTISSDCHDLVLGSKSLPKLGSWTQQQKGTAVEQHRGGSGMGLWELSLGSGTVKLADRSLTCSPDFCGMHRNSWRLLRLWAGTQQYDRLGSRRWGSEEVKVGEVGGGKEEWVFGKGICSDWVGLHLDVRFT